MPYHYFKAFFQVLQLVVAVVGAVAALSVATVADIVPLYVHVGVVWVLFLL
jgi:hypothetical protein